MPKFDSTAFQRRCPHIYYNERKGPVMANRMVLHKEKKKYNLVSDESADYMHEVAELARQIGSALRRLAARPTRAGTGNGHAGG